MIESYTTLRDRALSIKSKKELSTKNLLNSQTLLNSKIEELKQVKENRLIQESSIKVLNNIIELMSKENIKKVVDIATYALQTIFTDKDYALELEIRELRSKNTCELYLIDSTDKDNIVKSHIKDIGGGVQTVISFVLRIFYIMYYNLNRILFLDEALSAVSIEYIPSLMEFIKSLSEQRGFTFLAVCHDNRFFEYADKIYLMKDGVLTDITHKDLEDVERDREL